MSTVAIIAEYNPFHNGHLYHLKESKRISGADHAIAIMSGNFVQRGEPAILPKLRRAEYAVRFGLDIVFEMPVRYSTASAQDFAYAGVEMINSLGIADYLSFGAETNDIDIIRKISDCLTNETASFKLALNDFLKEGNSYPKARSLALAEEFGEEYADIMSQPNNILAIEYLSALTKLDSRVKPIVVPRKGAAHDSSMTKNKFASAKYIRDTIQTADNNDISSYVPYDINEADKFVFSNDIETLINHELLNLQSELSDNGQKLNNILDLNSNLINRIQKLNLPLSYSELIEELKSKNITHTRLCRTLLHILLGIENIKDNIYCPYATLLAFRKDASHMFRSINDSSDIRIINKRSSFEPANEYEAKLYKYDCYATDIYNLLYYSKTKVHLPNELSSNIAII